ncbi:D-alanyl-D-alanine carboxypeptidase family protein [Peptoniphilus indolicus]|uniref:serine-type D-Ala-D-Ala carboxypeptidase n=2 Tax=Peptoniphilus indolicus TaxID=33030 RepID=G4D2N4_9FIRM|nr:D-alanyl-D-alanine carboxypeptidase family protein [Peptoniphilus indolicus]EGY80217.1 serine-type D-Ala-D-Ala carboxypeptidase [Peptoniphilus indolicus ATCC 29427]SUB75252.1 D-alanyl-D-alanine carboxypeptidase dacC precursor [Peptoniphilus indolicus]
MKKLTIFLLSLVLLGENLVYANSEVKTPEKKESNVETEIKEIRNQNILVPTKKGVQKATQAEADKIKSLEERPLESLTGSYILGDYKSGKILESYNIDEVRAMASMSKIVGVYVVFDAIKANKISMEDKVTIDSEAARLTGSTYKLKEGDIVAVKDLIKAALVVSGNDAITSLGKHIYGSKEEFVNEMNEKCKALGLKHAEMVNPTGLTDYSNETYNKMTTREMFILARHFINDYPEALKYTSIESIIEPERNFEEYNTNPILGVVRGVDGLKTGYTNAAGRCLMATALKKGEGKSLDTRLIGIITGAPSDWARYVAAKKLVGGGLEKYRYTVIGNLEEPVAKLKVENSEAGEVNVFEKSTGNVLWDGKSEIKKTVTLKEGLLAPIPAGEVVGKITYTMDGEEILKQDVIVKDRVLQKGFIYKIQHIYRDIINNIKAA